MLSRPSLLAAALLLLAAPSSADDAVARNQSSGVPAGADSVIIELSRRIDLLAAELERERLGAAAAKADRSERGLGPAASKVYRTDHGASLGGYGEMLYESFAAERDDSAPSARTDRLDFLRAVLYVGYKFSDRWLLNSEFEFEHGSTGEGGEVAVEFAYVDYLWRPAASFRAGLVLLPVGLVNELHEPTVFLGARRPAVEQALIPTTWRENGAGMYGDVGPLSYRTYVVSGLDASGFSAAGIRGGRQAGARASAEDWAWVGRLDLTSVPGLLAGGSVYSGGSGQGLMAPDGDALFVSTTLVEGHGEWKWRGFAVRGLAVGSWIGDAAELSAALSDSTTNVVVGEEQIGGYIEVGYDVFAERPRGELSLTPFIRYERFDTQAEVPAGLTRSEATDQEILTAGAAFRPLDSVVFKLDYQDVDNAADTGVNQFNVALGYIF
jgi:hypothetical protein